MRGLKPSAFLYAGYALQSHPVWVRGLKHLVKVHAQRSGKVAPRVGAWIETSHGWRGRTIMVSHPVWVRGLKLAVAPAVELVVGSHPVWVRGLKL